MKARWIGLGIGAALCLAACGDAARPAVVEGSASPADATAGAGIVAAATAPYARAERALAAGRILAPAGDNAIEHYLDARAQPSERVRARAALARSTASTTTGTPCARASSATRHSFSACTRPVT